MNSTLLRDHRLLPYALIAPAIVLLSVFYLYPIGYNAVLSLFSWDLRGPMTFIGFDNFAELASDPDFGLVLRNTVVYTVTEVILVMLIGLGLALYLNSLRRFGGFLQAVTFAPNVVALVSVSLIFVWLMDTDNGLFNQLLASAGLPEVGWLSDPDVALFSLVLVSVWKSVGLNALILLAALRSIPTHLFEAAALDNAGISGQEATLLEGSTQARLMQCERARNPVAHRARLARQPTALNRAPDIVLVDPGDRCERLV